MFEKFIGKDPGDLKMKCKTASDQSKNQLEPLLCTQEWWGERNSRKVIKSS